MRKKVFLVAILFALMWFNHPLCAQVGINTDGSQPDPSAGLDVKFSGKGVLVPRMTESERNGIQSPATGLMIYQTDQDSGFYYHNGTGWARIGDADGSETKVTAGTNVIVTGIGTNADPYVINSNGGGAGGHYIGELYGGGVVFWVDNTGQHGLICSMIDLSSAKTWSNVTSSLVGETAQSYWNGVGNSNAIVNQFGHITSAAELCLDYTNVNYGTGVYSDWYLPAFGELNRLWSNIYEVQKTLDNDGNPATTAMTGSNYWSSTESVNNWAFYFFYNAGSAFFKYYEYAVRAVRSF